MDGTWAASTDYDDNDNNGVDESSSLSSSSTPFLSFLADLWQTTYNAPDSMLPLYLPLTLWVGTYLYSQYFMEKEVGDDTNSKKKKKKNKINDNWHQWQQLHNFHNLGVILLGQISLWNDNDAIFRERIATLFTTGYFVVDLVDCVVRHDVAYTFHAVCTLLLCGCNYYLPLCQELRMTSQAALLECSSPFLHLCQRTRNPWHFALFAAVFTACRIVWLPYIMYQLLYHPQDAMAATHPLFLVLVAFYGLNLYWYYKILRIMVKGSSSSSSSSGGSSKDDTNENNGSSPSKESKKQA